MSRAKLFHLPGCVWHLTHRCHNRDFLLKFKHDRKTWLHWLLYAKKKYNLIILNYSLTSNHIHLVVYDDGKRNVIPHSMMLVSSRVALEYNKRKNRSGAFWEDNYHATAVGTESHLHRCLIYVDLNMVRAKVVDHPKDWPFCGYHELTEKRLRYCLIDKPKLMELLRINHPDELKRIYEGWVEQSLSSGDLQRESIWTESIAVGDRDFVEHIEMRLGMKVKYREIEEKEEGFVLKEAWKKY
ncbi:MAG: transposase [Candidatus Aminicenantes bacterium]|nr:transposase [Candidatus Aminicenantes bacterium]